MSKRLKKIIGLFALLIICTMYILRVQYVNAKADRSVIREYQKGEIVPFDKDFNVASNMIIDGYSVKVKDSHLYPKKEFVNKYNIKSSVMGFTKYFYTIDVTIYNKNKSAKDDEKSGIYLSFMPLITPVDYILPDTDVTQELNPNLPGETFSLRPDSELDVTIVYPLNKPYFTSLKEAKAKDFKMLITQYPVRKILKLK